MQKIAYKITYDRVAEAIYMYINKGKIENTLVLNENVNIDVDGEGRVIGMEILGVSDKAAEGYKKCLSMTQNPVLTLI